VEKGRGALIVDYNKDIKEVIRETISFICFCNKEFVPIRLCQTMSGFMRRLESLPTTILKILVDLQETSSVEYLLQERDIAISSQTIPAATTNRRQGKDLFAKKSLDRDFLHDYRREHNLDTPTAGNDLFTKEFLRPRLPPRLPART
jgi:hypothetical protein